MKITKFLPIALVAIMLAPASFAASGTASSNLQINVPEFINITTTSPSAKSATFDDNYSQITLNEAMVSNFHVITNYNGKQIKLSASALADGPATAPALFGTAASPIIVLSNETVKPTTAQIASCGALSAVAENPNCIAFKLTPTITPDSATPAAIQGTPALASNEITYTLTNGIYDFKYTSGLTAEGTTFSTHDEMGTYKATLTMTEIAI